MLQKSLSKRLLTSVLSVYFLLTFVVTCGQVLAEYLNTKDYIKDEDYAKENKLGLWSGDFVTPETWRSLN